MMVTQPIGGLANQLCVYAAAKNIAKCNNQELLLDLSHFHEKSKRNFRFNELNIDYKVASPWLILFKFKRFAFNSNKVFRYISDKVNKAGLYGRKCHDETSLNFDSSLFNLTGDCFLAGNFISYKYYADSLPQLSLEFKPRNLSDNVYRLINKINLNNFASIHFRRGDYIAEKSARDFHGVLGEQYYIEAVEWLKKNRGVKTFYVFTDDVTLAKKSFEFIEDINFVDQDNLTDIEELELMKYFKNNIIANSGFSRWAGLLNYNENPTVIMPKQWFKAIDIATEEIAPPTWIRIDSNFELFN